MVVASSTNNLSSVNYCKNEQGFFTQVCENFQDVLRMKDTEFNLETGFTNADTPWAHKDPAVLDVFEAEDHCILRTGRSSYSKSFLIDAENNWAVVLTQKDRIPGGIRGRSTLVSVHRATAGWSNRLDWNTETLDLLNGERLSRRELRILHRLLLNHPRKLIARDEGISVKMVEKIQKHLKEKFRLTGHTTLHDRAHQMQLTGFILSQPDWFDPTPLHWVGTSPL